tara:strand:- start:338 stop:559 length:222 start_codon:yes stop_codon:yes gene_type:complete
MNDLNLDEQDKKKKKGKSSKKQSSEEVKEQDRSPDQEIMLGSIISKVKVGNDDIICIQRRIEEIALRKQSYFT